MRDNYDVVASNSGDIEALRQLTNTIKDDPVFFAEHRHALNEILLSRWRNPETASEYKLAIVEQFAYEFLITTEINTWSPDIKK